MPSICFEKLFILSFDTRKSILVVRVVKILMLVYILIIMNNDDADAVNRNAFIFVLKYFVYCIEHSKFTQADEYE